MVTYAILGPVALYDAGRRLPIGGSRQLALLAFLLLHANRAVTSDELIATLWGDAHEAGAIKRLHVSVARLRRRMEQAAGADAAAALRTTASGYMLELEEGQLDADVFERRVRKGQQALRVQDAERAAHELRAALSLWRGTALADVAYEPFAQGEIRRLEELRLAALEDRIEADLLLGHHGALVGELEALVAASPTRERMSGQLMLALYRCGRQADALDAYRRARAHLTQELGLEPGPGLRALESAIFEQAPSLDLSERPRVVQAAPLPPLIAGLADPFVGREGELEHLAGAWRKALDDRRPRVVFLAGEPGIGKTSLAAQFALRVHEEGAIVLYGRCDEEPLVPHQPFVEALRHHVATSALDELQGQVRDDTGELHRIVPELAERLPDLRQPQTDDPDGARYRLFEAVRALLLRVAQTRPLMLVLDDLHWADQPTLLLLRHVARAADAAALLVLGTYRDTELQPSHPLPRVLADLAREHGSERDALAPLDEAAVAQLVSAHAGDEAPAELRRAVWEGAEGNPFFVVELLRHITESPVRAGQRGIPDRLKGVIASRLERLGEQANRALAIAAVAGRIFDVQLLHRLSDLGEEQLVDLLDRAVAARVIDEGAAGHYAFSHALIRETIYTGLTATKRALLHRRIALALEQTGAGDLDAELAHHFAAAGSPDDLDKAIEYCARAGDRAAALLAHEQAASHYRKAVALIGDADPERRCELLIAQGEAERQAGDRAHRATLLEGADLARRLGDADRLARAALAANRGVSSSAQGVDRERVAVLEAALSLYDPADSQTRARLLADLAIELVADPDYEHRVAISSEALAMARRLGHPRTVARVLTKRVQTLWGPRTLRERQTITLEAETLADEIRDPLLALAAISYGVHTAMEAGDLARADALLERIAVLIPGTGQPVLRWYERIARAKRCSITGRPRAAEYLAGVALELGQCAGQSDAFVWFVSQVVVARFLQGTLDGDDPDLPALFSTRVTLPVPPEISEGRSVPLQMLSIKSLTFAELGRTEDARMYFEELMGDGLGDLQHDYAALAIPAVAAVVCWHLGDARRAEELYELLAPYDEQFVDMGPSWFGAVTHHVALLAVTLGRLDEADARFAAAARMYTQLGAGAWLARTHVEWAQALLARDAKDDVAAAADLLARALDGARALDLDRLVARAAALGVATAPSDDQRRA